MSVSLRRNAHFQKKRAYRLDETLIETLGSRCGPSGAASASLLGLLLVLRGASRRVFENERFVWTRGPFWSLQPSMVVPRALIAVPPGPIHCIFAGFLHGLKKTKLKHIAVHIFVFFMHFQHFYGNERLVEAPGPF